MAKDFFNGKKLTYKEMLSYINKDFYNLVKTKRDLTEFTRQLLDAYCDEKGIAPVTLTTSNFKKNHFATYFRFTSEIKINQLLLKAFDYFRETQNFYFVQEYFDTILHELRHHEQFVSACKDFHPVVKYTSQIMKRFKAEQIFDKYSYHGNPVELDARYFAYSELKENKTLSPYYLSDYYREREIAVDTQKALDYASLLKDRGLWKVKGITKPLRLLEKSIQEIANLYKLQFVSNKAPEVQNISWGEAVNNVKLAERINSAIAPGFYNDNFILIENPDDIEEMVEDEVVDYNDFIDSIIEIEKTRRNNLRKERENKNQSKSDSKNNKSQTKENSSQVEESTIEK